MSLGRCWGAGAGAGGGPPCGEASDGPQGALSTNMLPQAAAGPRQSRHLRPGARAPTVTGSAGSRRRGPALWVDSGSSERRSALAPFLLLICEGSCSPEQRAAPQFSKSHGSGDHIVRFTDQ